MGAADLDDEADGAEIGVVEQVVDDAVGGMLTGIVHGVYESLLPLCVSLDHIERVVGRVVRVRSSPEDHRHYRVEVPISHSSQFTDWFSSFRPGPFGSGIIYRLGTWSALLMPAMITSRDNRRGPRKSAISRIQASSICISSRNLDAAVCAEKPTLG